MPKYSDVSIHFQWETHTLEDIECAINDYFNTVKELDFDFCYETQGDSRTVLHHCFENRNDEKEGLYEIIDMLASDDVCWNTGANRQNILMLENVKKLGGASIFVGDIIGDVAKDFCIAERMGIPIIRIEGVTGDFKKNLKQ